MAGARPSAFRKGGGFLNDVDGEITNYEFTTEPEFLTKGGGKRKSKSDFNALYAVLSVRVDGADEDVETTFFVGSADEWEISDDGKTLTGDGNLQATIGWGLFISSLVEHGFPENDLPEDEVNFEPIIGWRVRFVQQTNEKATAKYGKRKAKKGKGEYDRTDVVVSQVYDYVQPTARGGKAALKTTARPTSRSVSSAASRSRTTATTATSRSSGKPNGRVQEQSERHLEDDADTLLIEILGDKDGEIKRKGLTMEVTKRRMKDPNRDALRDLIFSDDYLTGAEERGLIAFNQKTQTVTAA